MSGQGNGLGGCRSGWGCAVVQLAAVGVAVAALFGALLFAIDAQPPARTGAQTEATP